MLINIVISKGFLSHASDIQKILVIADV